jgi:hypothetical protein
MRSRAVHSAVGCAVTFASVIRETIRLRMSKKRAETRTINMKRTIEKG